MYGRGLDWMSTSKKKSGSKPQKTPSVMFYLADKGASKQQVKLKH
jgi:hypothetical protein